MEESRGRKAGTDRKEEGEGKVLMTCQTMAGLSTLVLFYLFILIGG